MFSLRGGNLFGHSPHRALFRVQITGVRTSYFVFFSPLSGLHTRLTSPISAFVSFSFLTRVDFLKINRRIASYFIHDELLCLRPGSVGYKFTQRGLGRVWSSGCFIMFRRQDTRQPNALGRRNVLHTRPARECS